MRSRARLGRSRFEVDSKCLMREALIKNTLKLLNLMETVSIFKSSVRSNAKLQRSSKKHISND
jgi:hypothetical protein